MNFETEHVEIESLTHSMGPKSRSGEARIKIGGIHVFTVNMPTEKAARDIAERLVDITRSNRIMAERLRFISGIVRKDGVPVSSAAIARRTLAELGL